MNSRFEVLLVLSEYPLLVPTNSYRKWEGYVSVKTHQFKAVINVPNFPTTEKIFWEFHPQVEMELIIQRSKLAQSKTFIEFLHNVQHIIENSSSLQKFTNSSVSWNEHYALLYKQIIVDLKKSLNSCYIEEIGKDFKIKVSYMDSKYFRHTISLSLKIHDQKIHFKIIHHDLPSDAISILSQISSLSEFFSKLEEIIESLIPFWDICNTLEGKCWIVNPINPKKSDTYRQIYLAEDLSIMLRFNPFDVTSLPDVKFLGSLNAVNEARETFQNCLEMYDGWDSELDVLENLERLLEIKQFPMKEDVEQERYKFGTSNYCLICFVTNAEQPVKYCLNKKCSALFHHSCLLKWFETSQISTVGPHDYLRGPCPCCETVIYCPRTPVSIGLTSAF